MSSAQTSAAPGFRRSRRKPGQNRLSLIEAGTIQFGLYGYAAAQTAAIARQAGVSQPNVYANFASKSDLFLSCVEALDPAELLGAAPSAERHTPGDSVSGTLSAHDAGALLLFQAVAAAADPVLAPRLPELLRALMGGDASGEQRSRFNDLLAHAAGLLTASGEK